MHLIIYREREKERESVCQTTGVFKQAMGLGSKDFLKTHLRVYVICPIQQLVLPMNKKCSLN